VGGWGGLLHGVGAASDFIFVPQCLLSGYVLNGTSCMLSLTIGRDRTSGRNKFSISRKDE
jgi:hypothetical protein